MVQDSDTIERMMRSDCGYEEFYEESSRLAPDWQDRMIFMSWR